jgi:DNA polymerase III subunit delta'
VNYEAYPWQPGWLSSVRETVRTRHHAWMIVGRDGDGLAQAGAALAASLLCETPKHDVACGECPSCRWLAGDVHPDFIRLAPEESDDDVARLPIIKTDAAREAIAFMELSASTQRGRVLLIDPATALSRESANALLKAIEEPPPNTRWLLLASRPAKLLPTIRSRALRLTMPSPSREAAASWLADSGVARNAVDRALQLARGAPLAAHALAEAETLDIRDKFFRDLSTPRELPTLAWGAWVEAGGKSGRRARFAALLDLLGDWLTDWARVRSTLVPHTCSDFSESLLRVGPRLSLSEGLRYHRELLRKLYVPDTTLSARLQVESILLDYRGKFA